MLQLQRASQRVSPFYSFSYMSCNCVLLSLKKAAPRALLRYRQAGRVVAARGLATPSEPYDAVIIGGGA